MKKVVAIVGPTASGKTRLALFLKDHLSKLCLINGDSVQVYKGLNIGSDKISKETQEKYPHKLMDEISLEKDYTVYDYQIDVRKIIEKEKYPLIVGGSGFYIKSVLYDYRFVKDYKREGCKTNFNSREEKIEYIKLHDPKLKIDFSNSRKLERAIYLIENGIKPSLNCFENNPYYDFLIIYLDVKKEELEKNVLKRIKNQLSSGFKDEVKGLLKHRKKLKNILGYKQMLDLIDGLIDEKKYIELVKNNTMQLAKKQRTWFKNKMDILFFDAKSKTLSNDVLRKVSEFFGL